MQKSKFDPKKWVFGSQTWPKDRELDLRQNWPPKRAKKKTVKAKKRKRKRKKKRKRREEPRKVWKLTLSMDFYDFWYGTLWNSKVCMKFHEIVWVIACLQT